MSQKEITFEHKTEVINSGVYGDKSMLPFVENCMLPEVKIDPQEIKYLFAFDWLDLLLFVYAT